MKLISFKNLTDNAITSLKKFPLVILCAFLGVSISIFLVEYKDEVTNELPYINLILSFALGVPLFFCVTTFLDKNKDFSKLHSVIIHFIAFVFLTLIFVSLPATEETHNTSIPYIRYGIYNVIIHLLVSFAPYIKSKELNGFWNYNKALFLRLCASVLYTSFIYIGLVLALLAIDNLFHVDLDEKIYFELYIVTIGLFNTWFFISGVPKNIYELEELKEYPKGLKIFTQYVLLPLLVLYLIILYAYGSKIIFNWSWPKGWVSYLVSGVSILGFFNILLIYPYGKLKGNSWIQKFSKIFFYILLPLVLLLFTSIFMRVNDYGITINRYAIILLGIWICMVCLFFIFKKDNIKFIPISLAALLLITSFGPWGIFSVSEQRQVKRLQNILERSHLLQNGTIQNEVLWVKDSLPKLYSKNRNSNKDILSDSLHNEVKSILDYLEDYHGLKSIRPWFSQNIDSLINPEQYYFHKEARTYMQSMGLEYRHYYKNDSYFNQNGYSYYTSNPIIQIKDYDFLYKFNIYSNSHNNAKSITTEKGTFTFKLEHQKLLVLKDKDKLVFNFADLYDTLLQTYGNNDVFNVPIKELILKGASENLEAKLQLNRIRFTSKKDSTYLESLEGYLMFNQK